MEWWKNCRFGNFSFHAQDIKEWEKTPFYASNVNCWAHRRCFEQKCLTKLVDFVHSISSYLTSSTEVEEVTPHCNVEKKLAKFLYLGDVLSSGGEVQEVVTEKDLNEKS